MYARRTTSTITTASQLQEGDKNNKNKGGKSIVESKKGLSLRNPLQIPMARRGVIVPTTLSRDVVAGTGMTSRPILRPAAIKNTNVHENDEEDDGSNSGGKGDYGSVEHIEKENCDGPDDNIINSSNHDYKCDLDSCRSTTNPEASVTSDATTSSKIQSSSVIVSSNTANNALVERQQMIPAKRRLPIPGSTTIATASSSSSSSSSSLFQRHNHKKIMTVCCRRAPLMSGLQVPASSSSSSSAINKKFQRPMLHRRAYNPAANAALQQCSLGQRRRINGMAHILARAGHGLTYRGPDHGSNSNNMGENSDDDDENDDHNKEEDRPFEPLCAWKSPHEGGPLQGLPAQTVRELRSDEYGVEEWVTVLRPAPVEQYATQSVFVPPVLAKWLRPHQREGVTFMYQCVMGLRNFRGNGCILADDMGLRKTLQSVSLIYTLLKTGIAANKEPTAKRVIVICPCSLVKNWFNEFVKWLGPGDGVKFGGVKPLAIAEADRKQVERDLDSFVNARVNNVLIASYECIRTHYKRLAKKDNSCDLMVCDEAHRLKNADNQTSRALNAIPCRRRVLLTGTPMQNDLQEFYAMVDFTNPGILGTPEQFRKNTLFPILRGREPDATEAQKQRMMQIQNDMSQTVNEFILRRINTLNAQHLPPKLVQVVCCNLTEIQQNMYQHLINSKDMQHILRGKQQNCLGSIQMLMKLCNHPSLIAEEDKLYGPSAAAQSQKRAAAAKAVTYNLDATDLDGRERMVSAAPGADGVSKFLPLISGGGGAGRRGDFSPVHPEWSGKMFVLYRLMKEMRKPGNGNDKIVIVSNYTQTLDLIGRMCRENSWGFCRLDGSITMKKRQKMVDEFNDPGSSLIAFLLSSKAGGCGLNLIGGNRLVLFDPDWNPAVDKQAAARCWRDGQKKRCFTYRFLATGTVEEKIFQRQLSKEGLQSVVDDKEQVNTLSTKDLRNLFKLRVGTPSDTHDKLRCERCDIIHDNAELEAAKILPMQLESCKGLLEELCQLEDAKYVLNPLVATEHDRTKEEYEAVIKQPIDFGIIRAKLNQAVENATSYKDVSGFSKDINRVFSNVLKLWSPGEDLADAARRLQSWWTSRWTDLVPVLMTMKPNDQKAEHRQDTDDPSERDNLEEVLAACAGNNNVRGDDYQEQIGMPDEENMRSWSHHYSTNTVDDPVFRAAIRGCDAVSFVFGLEVTYSLIQQRQQEEEERAAMMELGCIEEQPNEDVTATKACDNEQGMGECNIDDDDDEQKCQPSGERANGSNCVGREEGEEQEDAIDVSDVNKGLGRDEDSEDENDSDHDQGHDNADENDPKVPTDGGFDMDKPQNCYAMMEPEHHPTPCQWECPVCTLLNEKSARTCTVCHASKTAAIASSSRRKRSIHQLA